MDESPQSKLKPLPVKSPQEAIAELWRRGVLEFKLNSAQKVLYNTFKTTTYRVPVFNISRRGGKSYTLLIIAIEQCIKAENSIVHYACPTAVMASKIIIPTIRTILQDCPVDMRPEYIKNERCFNFKNGSKIQIEGTDEGNAERLRGSATDLGIVDEAGFVDDLEYVINDILLPQTLTTDGKLLLSSTPPREAGHPFTKFIQKAKMHDAYVKLSMPEILDLIQNDKPAVQKHLNRKIVDELKDAYGGELSSTWRREFLVEMITDTTHAVIPEFTDAMELELVKDWPRQNAYDAYTSMDPGVTDATGVLFAYLDFLNQKLIIEDEYLVQGKDVTTSAIANSILQKEKLLWQDWEGKTKPVYLRVSDNNEPILLNDLRTQFNINFMPARKDDKDAAISDVRNKILYKKIIINTRCKNLIFQLKTATWNKSRRSYNRSAEGGHADLLDALCYMVRHVDWNKNPYPKYQYDSEFTYMRPKGPKDLTGVEKWMVDTFTIGKKPKKPNNK